MKKVLVLVLVMLATVALQACSYSSAKLTDAKLCATADSEGICGADETTFKPDTPEIFLSANLENAPSDTKVTATWTYLKGELGNEPQEIDAVTAETKEGGDMPFQASLSAPTSGWPKGDYEVTLTLSNDNTDPIKKQFSVK